MEAEQQRNNSGSGAGLRAAVYPANAQKNKHGSTNFFEAITEEKLREETAKCNDRLKKLHFRNYQVDEEIKEHQELVQRYHEDFKLFEKQEEDPNSVREYVIAQQHEILQREIRMLENSIIGLERAIISPERRHKQTPAAKAVYDEFVGRALAIETEMNKGLGLFISKDFLDKPQKESEKLKADIKKVDASIEDRLKKIQTLEDSQLALRKVWEGLNLHH